MLATALNRGALLVLAALLLLPAPARAHGDPANEVLETESVFLPADARIDGSIRSRLEETAASAQDAGVPVKVAVLTDPEDIGPEVALWGKPQRYARALAAELAFGYKGRVLVVMWSGFGFWNAGKPIAAERALLRTIDLGRDANGLALGGIAAVRRLAAQAGHPLPPPKTKHGSQAADRVVIVGVAVGLLVLGVLFRFRRRLLRR